ncbi:Stk1 family PASTA domain-containing Ser/Thr kinase [Pseudonocardiaceae bacterium YIM PH 21723]|nr:Stk1 family PASTA domain-containing Ser/Thr kinase [Pseudonocardiaceae bacterium YIM PH 21723]
MSTTRLLSNRYELGDTLGYGGMSEVHRGRDVRLGRDVAVKVLRADLARDPQFQIRFRREAQNAAALNHPAIVAVYDTGETTSEFGPLPYIVMEFVDGQTLRDIVKTEGPLDNRRAIEVMADACAALDFSHRHGIIHRDVKPANIMITNNGAVKVMDFGIARALADGQAAVTQTAAVIGTAQYLSPEQARGEAVDARSDVYAAGCVLFELLCGEPPFTGDSPVAVAYQHVREDPPEPSSVNPDVSPALDAIVLKAMSKNPANRYQSAAEMRADLVRVLSGQRPMAPMVMTEDERTSLMTGEPATDMVNGRHHPGPAEDYGYDQDYEYERGRKRRRNIIAALVGLLCVGVIAAVVFLLSKDNKAPDAAEQIRVPAVVGVEVQQAKNQLTNAGFKVTDNSVVATSANDKEIGKVTKTDPPGGEQAAKGTTVTVTWKKSPDKVTVPNLKGMTKDDATKALSDNGLTVGQTLFTEVEDSNQVDKVQKQNPNADTQVSNGTAVDITLGKASEQLPLPDVTNQTEEQAKDNLTRAGFLNVVSQEIDSDKDPGTVVRQDPAGGGTAKAKKNQKITLSVSKSNTITMPTLVNMTQEDARAALAARGWDGTLTVNRSGNGTSAQVIQGLVSEQNPKSGTRISKSQPVTITIPNRVDNTKPTN